MRKPRILIWDIEATDLEASFGTVLCIGYKWYGEKETHVISNLDKKTLLPYLDNDSRILKKFREIYEQADYTVAHFGQFYDLPFVQTRLAINKLPFLPPATIKDTWKTSKKKLKLKSNSLKYIARALGIKMQKTDLDGLTWKKAARGDRRAMKYVVHHCFMDVKVLEQVWKKLRGLESESLPASTHECGDKYLQSNGRRVCAKKVYRRLFCTNCGDWFKGEII